MASPLNKLLKSVQTINYTTIFIITYVKSLNSTNMLDLKYFIVFNMTYILKRRRKNT